jgi:hypothetical protein
MVQSLDDRGWVSDVIVENRDLRTPPDSRPIGHPQRDILKVVQNRNFHVSPFFKVVLGKRRRTSGATRGP